MVLIVCLFARLFLFGVCLFDCAFVWLVGWLVRWLMGCLFVWVVCCLRVRLHDCLVDYLLSSLFVVHLSVRLFGWSFASLRCVFACLFCCVCAFDDWLSGLCCGCSLLFVCVLACFFICVCLFVRLFVRLCVCLFIWVVVAVSYFFYCI